MDIIAASYHNIGPFLDQTISIFLHKGKFLIKAPIGSGKSFLFFDGLMYGLYKNASRKMLHVQAKEGYIKILYKIHDTLYLVCRDLRLARVKESCSSRLYEIQQADSVQHILETYSEILYYKQDIEKIVRDAGVSMEAVTFKNEIDLQQSLSQLLPPREVLMSTSILMQDDRSIFDYTPSDRLSVLKNMFNLLDIDHAKERISERKREVYIQRNQLSNFSRLSAKLQKNLQQYIQSMQEIHQDINLAIDDQTKQFIIEMETIGDKIQLQDFALATLPYQRYQQYDVYIREKLHKWQEYEQAINAQYKVIQEYEQQELQTHQQYKSMEQELKSIQDKLNTTQAIDPNILHEQLGKLQTEQASLQPSIAIQDAVQTFIAQHDSFDLQEFGYADIQDLGLLIRHLTNYGKQLSQQSKSLQDILDSYIQRKQELDSTYKHSQYLEGSEMYRDIQDMVSTKQKQWKEALEYVHKQVVDIHDYSKQTQEQIQKFEQLLQVQEQDIDRIIGEIRQEISLDDEQYTKISSILRKYIDGDSRRALEQQIQDLQYTLNSKDIEEKLRMLRIQEQQLHDDSIQIVQNPKMFLSDRFAYRQDQHHKVKVELDDITTQIKEKHLIMTTLDLDISHIRNFLERIGRKQIQLQLQRYQELHQQIVDIEAKIRSHQESIKQQQELTQQEQQLGQSIISLTKQQEHYRVRISQVQANLETIRSKQLALQHEKLVTHQQYLQEAEHAYHTVQGLIEEFTDVSLRAKQLQEQETMLGHLYTIFSKEILLAVLSESIPSLNDIINTYLAQVVDYQLLMQITKTPGDTLELQAMVQDDSGIREVKSLSTGQRTVLKLVWMLAVASYLHIPMLLLDETINHIDSDTVGKVSTMITDFVKQHHIKFYTVTHHERIQEMRIWDQIIQLPARKNIIDNT